MPDHEDSFYELQRVSHLSVFHLLEMTDGPTNQTMALRVWAEYDRGSPAQLRGQRQFNSCRIFEAFYDRKIKCLNAYGF
jgi:hypothetical protein